MGRIDRLVPGLGVLRGGGVGVSAGNVQTVRGGPPASIPAPLSPSGFGGVVRLGIVFCEGDWEFAF